MQAWTIGFLLAVFSAVFWASLDISRKRLGAEMSAVAVVVGIMFWQVPFIVPFMAATEAGLASPGANALADIVFVGLPELGWNYAWLAAVSVALNTLANLLFVRAVQISPLSLTTPYLSFTPVFSALAAFALLGQTPAPWGIAGIVTVCLGAFFLNPGHKDQGVFAPLKALWTERGSLYMVIVALIWSVTPVLDKEASELTSPMWHTLVLGLGIGVFLVGWVVARGNSGRVWREQWCMPWWLAACGFFSVGAMILQLGSYAFIEIAYVETVKRAIGVVSAIAAGYLLFGERDIGRRLAGAAVMVAGVAMVLLSESGGVI